uniref:U4/U6 small nuclear ribonucleoprotein Prp3 n=1 Tax=Meloidogyne incognita TaxID=6306 RepID=A0A914KZV2_MELIC
MQIQERMKGLGLPLHQLSAKSDKFNETVLRPDEAIAFAQLHMEKVQRLNEMKTKLAKSLSNVNVKTPSLVLESMASDNKWGILSEQQSKLKPVKKEEANYEEKNAQTTPILKKTIEAEPDSSTGPVVDFQDPRLYLKPALRKRRHFDFKQPGEYEKMAKMQRSKAKLEKLQSEIEKAAKQTGISSAVKLAIVTPSGLPETSTGEYIPEVEWWDEVVLGNGKRYENIPSVVDIAPLDRYADTITDLVEHPIQLKPPDEPLQPQYLKASLTKKERKKLRRQNRREAIKEKTEKIRLGLDKPPEPKLKISNLMRVLGTDAIQDPTKMEAVVRKQMAEREQKHIDENRSRKLTREEKASKAIRKVAEDTSLAVHVAVYKVKSLANPAKKFKVLMNAKQLQMTGTIIQLEDINVIIVEGGPKQQKFYKNLMLNRIKWSEEIAGQRHVRKGAQLDEDSQQSNQGKLNECTLVWEGIVQKRAFNGEPRFIQVSNHKQAREVLDKYGVAHYWDLCYATSVLLSDDK